MEPIPRPGRSPLPPIDLETISIPSTLAHLESLTQEPAPEEPDGLPRETCPTCGGRAVRESYKAWRPGSRAVWRTQIRCRERGAAKNRCRPYLVEEFPVEDLPEAS